MLIIFTDLDGTLLNADNYQYGGALVAIQQLQTQQIPIIPVTSKTRAEVEELCQKLLFQDGFIVENGSAVFVPKLLNNFTVLETDRVQDYVLKQFGCSYREAVQGVRALAEKLNLDLRGFNDMDITEIAERTGLSMEAAARAKAREFTEPFIIITPKAINPGALKTAVSQLGFQIVVGDRFSHLIGQNAGKGVATQWFIQQFIQQSQNHNPRVKIQTVGLGNSPNDLAMLDVVDIPIIIPGKNGPHPGLSGRGWRVAEASGSAGWGQAVQQICQNPD
ncbi:MAG: HAD-IIB family hydrolase [Oscillatoriales cyanobacterium RM2_1_1]|nr:HAD-IIB family hydrolase [Oscillatoriales cyanobacterium SM2_3_0]NJO44640.1 HAD-IIB family hydrolase [Oscillatoriales cyanobacterium RM2_1_1]